jgi:hypothetical protein
MTIPLIVCVIGLIVWFVNSKLATPDPVIGEAGKWAFVLGLAGTLAALVGCIRCG